MIRKIVFAGAKEGADHLFEGVLDSSVAAIQGLLQQRYLCLHLRVRCAWPSRGAAERCAGRPRENGSRSGEKRAGQAGGSAGTGRRGRTAKQRGHWQEGAHCRAEAACAHGRAAAVPAASSSSLA